MGSILHMYGYGAIDNDVKVQLIYLCAVKTVVFQRVQHVWLCEIPTRRALILCLCMEYTLMSLDIEHKYIHIYASCRNKMMKHFPQSLFTKYTGA